MAYFQYSSLAAGRMMGWENVFAEPVDDASTAMRCARSGGRGNGIPLGRQAADGVLVEKGARPVEISDGCL